MLPSLTITTVALLIPLTVAIAYYDVRYRRIPNKLVLITLIGGIAINVFFGGLNGALSSVGGCALGLGLMLIPHVLGTMGAGDVKLFAAICAVLGLPMVIPAFIAVVLTGGALALYTMIRSGTVFSTLHGVIRIFVGLFPGWEMPRFTVPPDRRHTIPYGVAITIGTLVSLAFFGVRT